MSINETKTNYKKLLFEGAVIAVVLALLILVVAVSFVRTNTVFGWCGRWSLFRSQIN